MGGLTAARKQALVFGLMVVGVVLALTCVNAGAELVRRRDASCASAAIDPALMLPPSAYVLGGLGLLVGGIALFLLARWFGGRRQLIVLILFATAVAGVVFELFALITAVQVARTLSC